jgi:hypothetical protein
VRRLGVLAIVLAACGGDDVAPSPGWSAGPPLPEPLLEPGVIGFDGSVWVIGGFDDRLAVVTDTWILDDGAAAWRAGPAAPAPLTHMNLAVAGDRIYLLGGLETRDLVPNGASWRLSADRTAWEPLAPLPAGSERGAAATITTTPDRILVIGGATVDAAVASVLVYATTEDSWTPGADLPSPRSHPTGALDADGNPVVIGGLATIDATEPLAEVLALVGGTWEARAAMPTARGGCSAAVIDGSVYCAGGEAGTAVVKAAEAYDLAGDAWVELPDLPRSRGGTGGAALGGRLIAPGGAHRLAWEPTDDVDVFDPDTP